MTRLRLRLRLRLRRTRMSISQKLHRAESSGQRILRSGRQQRGVCQVCKVAGMSHKQIKHNNGFVYTRRFRCQRPLSGAHFNEHPLQRVRREGHVQQLQKAAVDEGTGLRVGGRARAARHLGPVSRLTRAQHLVIFELRLQRDYITGGKRCGDEREQPIPECFSRRHRRSPSSAAARSCADPHTWRHQTQAACARGRRRSSASSTAALEARRASPACAQP